MPIRPENRHRYPTDWPTISQAVKEAANWRCECAGECGRDHHGRCVARHGQLAPITGTRVVLTTAHLDHTPENCDPQNLRAMCQACHLAYDHDHHQQTRAATRAAALDAQMPSLFGDRS